MATHAAAALLLLTASLLAGTRCVHADAETIEELRDQLCRPVDSVPIVPPSRSWRVLDGTVMLTVFALFVAAVGFVLALLPPSLLFPHLRRRWGRPAGTAPRVLQIELPAEARASAKSDGRNAPPRPPSRPHTPKSRARSDSVRDVSSDAARDQASVITPEKTSTQPIKPYSASAFGSSSGSIQLAGGPSITVLTSKTFSTPVQGTLASLAPKPSLTNLAPAASAPEYSAHGVTRMKSEAVEFDVRGKQLGEVQIMKEQTNEIEDTMVEPIQRKPLNIQMVEEMEHVSINEDRIEEVGLEAKSSESQPSRASEVILKDVELAKESMEGKSLETESKEESTDAAQEEEEQAQPKEAEVLQTDPKKQGEMENPVVMMNSLVEDKQQFLAEKFQDPLRMNLRVMPCGLLTDSPPPFIREHLAFHHPELFALTQGIQIEPEPKSSTAAADEDEEERMAEQRRLVLKALRSDTSVSTMSEATPPSPAHSGTQISLGRRSSMDLWSMLVPGSRGESTEGGDVLEQYESYVPDEDYGYEETQEPDESSVLGDTYVPDKDPGPEEANESQETHELQLSVEPDGMFDGTYKPDEICAPDGFETGSPPLDHDDFPTLGVPGNFDELGDNLETIAAEEEPHSHDSMLDTPCVTTLSSSDLVQEAETDLQDSKESLTFEQRLADLFGEERMSPDSDAMALAASLREELAQAARERWEQEREALAQRVRAAARGRRAALSKLGAAALEARILRRSNQKLQVERERTQQKLSAAQHAYRQSQRDKKQMAKQLLALQMELVEQRSRWDEAVVASALGSRGRLLAHALAAAPAAAAGAPLPPATRSSTTVGAAPAPPPPPARPASAGAVRPSPLFSALQSVAVSTSDIPCGDKALPSVANLTQKISHALMQAGQFPVARHDVSTRTSPFYFMRSSETIPFTSASSSSRLLLEDPSVAGFADRGSPDSRKQFRSTPVDRARPEHWNMYHVPPSEPQVQWSGPELSDRTRMRGPLDVPYGPMYPGAKEAQSTREFDIDAMSCGGSCSRSYPQVPAPAAPEQSLPAAIVQSFISQLLAWTPLRPSASWDPRMRPRPSPERGEGAGAGAEASDGGDGEGERVGSVSARARRRRHPPSASASASASQSQSPAQSLARGGRRPRRGFHSKSGSSSPSVDAAAPRARRPQHAQSQRPPTGRAARARRRTPSPRRPVTPRVIERSRSRGRRSPTTGRWRDLRAGTPSGSPAPVPAPASAPAPPAAAGGRRARRNSMQDMLFESSEVSEREGSARPRRAHESPGLEASRTPSWGSVATPPGRMRSSDRREQAAARRRASRRRRSRSHLSRPPSSSTPSASSPDRRAPSDSVQNILLAHVGSSSHLHKSPCKSKVTFQDKPEAITERGKSSRHPRRLEKSTGETQITETPEKQSEDSKMSEAAAARPAQVPSLVELPPGAQAASAVALVCAPADAESVVAAAEAAASGAKAFSNLMPEIFAFPVAVMSPVALLLKSVMKESPPAEASQKEQTEAAAKNANEKSAEESSKAANKRSEEATADRAKNMLEESLKSLSGTRRETPKETEKEVMKMLEEAKIVETLRDSSTSAHIRPEIIRASGDCVYDVPPSEGSRAERKRQIVDQFSEEEMRNIENFVRSKQREELSGDEDEVLSIDGEMSGKTTPSYLCRGWDEDPTLSSEPVTASAATFSGARDASAVQTTSDLLDEPSDRMRPGGSPPMAVSSQSFHINDSSSLQSSDMSWDTPSPGDSSPPGIPWSPPQSTAFLGSSMRKSLEELTLSEASDRKSPPTRLPLCGAITSPPNVSPSTTSFTESTESPSPLQRSSSSPSPVQSPVESITAFHLALDSKVPSLSEDAQSPNALADQPSPRSLACSGLMSPMQESLPNLSSPQSPLKHSTVSQQALVSSVSSSQESTTLMESPQMSSTATSVWQFPQQSGERTPFGNESKHTIRSLVDAHSGEQSSTTMSPTLSLTSTPSPTQLSSAFETTQQGTILSSPQSLSMLETSKVSTLTESQSLQKSSSSLWQTSEISTLTSSLELSSKQPTELESDHETEMLFTGPLPQPLTSSTLSSPTQLSPIEEAQPEISQSPSPTASASSYRESPCLQSESLPTSSVWQSSILSGITSPFNPSSKQSIETLLATSPERPSSSTHPSCSSPLETELLQQQLLQSPLCLTSVSSLTSSLTDSTLKLSPSSAVESLPQSRVISPVEPKPPSSPMLQSPTEDDTPLGDYSVSTGSRSAFETIHRSGVTSPSGEDSDQSPPTSRPVSGSLHCISYSTLSTSGSPSPSQSSSLPESPTSNLPLHHLTEVGSTMDAFYEAMSTPLLQQQQSSLDAASKQLTPAESISLTGSSASSRAGSALPRPLPEAPTPPTSSLEGGSSSGSFLLSSLPATLRALDPAAPLAPRPRRDPAADHRLSIVEEETTVPSVDSGGATGTISSGSSESIPCNPASSSDYDPIDMSYSGVSGVCGCSRSESSRWSNDTCTSEEEVWELPAEKRWVRSAPPTTRPSQAPPPPAPPPPRSPFAATPHTPGVATASESEGVGASASRRGSSESWASASAASASSPSWNSESGIVTNSEAFRKFLDLLEPSPTRSEQDTPSGSVTASSCSGDEEQEEEEEDEQSALSAPVPATAAVAT